MFEMMQLAKQEEDINHKEFITWREFLTYFEDYRDIEQRNKKVRQFQATRELLSGKQEAEPETINHEEEFKSLLETEKERRLQELPKLRPQDLIDISEAHLGLLKGIFDNQPKVAGNSVATVSFFMALRKHKEVRGILSALARDPEGHSRLPKETFQQVFDRMEKDVQVKTIEWPTVIEYFTKRGRPLSKDEIQKLIDEDRLMKEELQEAQLREAEAERRRMARLMEDVSGVVDLDEEKKPVTRKNYSDDDNLSDRDDDQVFHDFDDDDEFGSDEDEEGGDADLERESLGTRRIARTRSAKGLGERNLNSERLTSDDYMHRLRAKSLRKGRYGVTVPKPFNFEIRDQKAKQPNTRERKVNEMIMEKKIEQENMIKHQFRHKPIPASVLIPRY